MSVGLGTTSIGPITGTGNFNVVKVEEDLLEPLLQSTMMDYCKNLHWFIQSVKSKIHFTEPPRGDLGQLIGLDNLPNIEVSFGGRVYLRQDYDTNQVFDDISKDFTGIGKTYTVTVAGLNTTGIETGSGVVFINDIFQKPSTETILEITMTLNKVLLVSLVLSSLVSLHLTVS